MTLTYNNSFFNECLLSIIKHTYKTILTSWKHNPLRYVQTLKQHYHKNSNEVHMCNQKKKAICFYYNCISNNICGRKLFSWQQPVDIQISVQVCKFENKMNAGIRCMHIDTYKYKHFVVCADYQRSIFTNCTTLSEDE